MIENKMSEVYYPYPLSNEQVVTAANFEYLADSILLGFCILAQTIKSKK